MKLSGIVHYMTAEQNFMKLTGIVHYMYSLMYTDWYNAEEQIFYRHLFFKTQLLNICTMNPTKFVMSYCEETFMYRQKQ